MSQWPTTCPAEGCEEECHTLREVFQHVKNWHTFANNLSLQCPVEGCCSITNSAEAFRLHCARYHKREYLNPSRAPRFATVVPDETRNTMSDINDPCSEVHTASNVTAPLASVAYEKFMQDLAYRCAGLRQSIEHKHNLPFSVASAVYGEVLSFAISLVKEQSEVCELRVDELGVTDKDLKHYLQNPDLESVCFSIPHCNLSVLKKLGYVEPQELDMFDLAAECGKSHLVRAPEARKEVMHYVPILETLKNFMSHPDVMRNITEERTDPCNISSFMSGSIYREHPLFHREPNALRLTIYSDELEVCNPLGGNNKKHKVCCVYFQVTNVGTRHLSALRTIHLAVLVRDSLKTKFGYDVVLKPMIDDLKVLADNGIDITVKGGGSFNFRGAVVAFIGDNLSAHHIGGYHRCFSSGKVCRWCFADYSDLCKLSSERGCQLRTSETMRRQAVLVGQDASLASVYGVVGPSPLSDIPYFVIPDLMPPDIMHDILEKFMCLNVKAVLRGLHMRKTLRYPAVLKLLQSHKFGVNDRVNKAPQMPSDMMQKCKKKAIRGSASQKWHLFRFLSIVLGPHIPEGNVYWKLHLIANRICDIIFAVAVNESMVRELETLVTSHHQLWVRLVKGVYPPKMHYMLHYPRFIRMHGPLRYLWCMRFEAFHLYLKRMAQKCNNFINLTKTLSSRVQKKRCLDYAGVNALPSALGIRRGQKSVLVSSLHHDLAACLVRECLVDETSAVLQVSSLTVNGLVVRRGCCNIIDVEGINPVFISVKTIVVVHSSEVFVHGTVFRVHKFNEHLHAFELASNTSEEKCLHVSLLLPLQTLHTYRINGKQYIKVKFTPLPSEQ